MTKNTKRLPTVISFEEFEQVLKNTKKIHHRLAFKLGFLCALRVSEIVNLKKGDIDRGRKMIHIRQGKGRKDRFVPYPKQLFQKWNSLSIPMKCGVRALQIAFKKAAKKAGIKKDVHFHTLRHSSVTHYIKQGMDISLVQRLAGHARLSTTEIYTHIEPVDVQKKMEEIWK